MVHVMLMIKEPRQSNWTSKGMHEFKVAPRVGDHIELEQGGEGYLYRVVAFNHPETPTMRDGDVFAVQVGPTATVLRDIFAHS